MSSCLLLTQSEIRGEETRGAGWDYLAQLVDLADLSGAIESHR